RAGRALAQISHFVVARQAGLDPDRFRSFERGATHLKEDELEAARQALEYYGVEFLPEDVDEGIGYGARRKVNQRTAKRSGNRENEGGPAYEADSWEAAPRAAVLASTSPRACAPAARRSSRIGSIS